jgi:hypothetical protein
MKVVFAGSSIYGVALSLGETVLRPPAVQGDIENAVHEGANVIGLIDGQFGQTGSVWHKEILYALSQGVVVLGAASMGALRAAECQTYGMIPVGQIAWAYCGGELIDDADVALAMAPVEFDFAPLSEPLVDALATIANLEELGCIEVQESAVLRTQARAIFFADRTDERIVRMGLSGERADAVLSLYRRHHVSLKAQDAMQLLGLVQNLRDERVVAPDWALSASPFWTRRESVGVL